MSDFLTREEIELLAVYRAEKLKQTARAALSEEAANKPVQFEDIQPGMSSETAAKAWDAIRKSLKD